MAIVMPSVECSVDFGIAAPRIGSADSLASSVEIDLSGTAVGSDRLSTTKPNHGEKGSMA